MFSNHQSGQRRPLADTYLSRTPVNCAKQGDMWHIDASQSPTSLSSHDHENIDSLTIDFSDDHDSQIFILAGRIVLMMHQVSSDQIRHHDDYGLIGVSAGMDQLRTFIKSAAKSQSPVLIRGESGTGKELIAQGIHQYSERANVPLVSVNIAAIPEQLVSTELFGCVKGAYTGALPREGLFKAAHRGTLFLDEVGETPTAIQVALLRSLETGTILPVGSDKEKQLDVRFIAATDANLEQLICDATFKMPLMQRLASLTVIALPLRDRLEDIGLLLRAFLSTGLPQEEQQLWFSNEGDHHYYWAWFFAQCTQQQWPGNVRALKNTVNQLTTVLRDRSAITSFDWLAFVAQINTKSIQTVHHQSVPINNELVTKRKPRDITDNEVFAALEKFGWQIKLAATYLHISRASLYLKMDAIPNIRRASHLSSDEISVSFQNCCGDLDDMVKFLKVSKPALRRRLNEIGLTRYA